MNLINKEFRQVGSNEVFVVKDIYKEKIILESKNGNRESITYNNLMDSRSYTPIDALVSDNKKFTINNDAPIDPKDFFNSNRTLNLFTEQIKSIPEDKIPMDDFPVTSIPSSNSREMIPSSDESAIIIDNDYDEAAEISRKYGIQNTSVGSGIQSQQEKFAKFLDEEEFPNIKRDTEVQHIEVERESIENLQYRDNNPIKNSQAQHIKVDDPITNMFRNVKRTIDFNLDLKIENKIPRLDFIEMMEDSYKVSIIEFLSEEFAEELLRNPNGLKKMISDRIRELVYGKNAKQKDQIVKTARKSAPKKAISKTSKSKKDSPTSEKTTAKV